MNISIQRSNERGATKTTWLNSRHSFSFANYWNPNRMNFGLLRVLNDDIIEPGTGFGMHPHDNMEIVTIVLKGALQHKDTMGNEDIINAGEIQRMSAGRGLHHSEMNPSKTESVHLLQIWVEPKQESEPSYEQRKIELRKNALVTVVSPNGPIHINQDAYFLLGRIGKGEIASYRLTKRENGVYIFVISGSVKIHNYELKQGDAAEITDVQQLMLTAAEDSYLLLIEVPME